MLRLTFSEELLGCLWPLFEARFAVAWCGYEERKLKIEHPKGTEEEVLVGPSV